MIRKKLYVLLCILLFAVVAAHADIAKGWWFCSVYLKSTIVGEKWIWLLEGGV